MKSKIISIKFLRAVTGKWGSFNVWNIGLENKTFAEYLYKGDECNFFVGDTVEYTIKKKPGFVDEIKLERTDVPSVYIPMPETNKSTLVQVKNSIDDRKWIYEQSIKIYTTGRDYSYGDGDILEIDKISKEIAKWLNESEV